MGFRPMEAGKYKEVVEELLAKVREDEDVLAIFLFGSVTREEQTPLSDMDT
jgi:predicted nucleotidyltransferase